MRCEKQGGKEGTAFLPPHLWHAIGQGSYMSSGFVRLGCLHVAWELRPIQTSLLFVDHTWIFARDIQVKISMGIIHSVAESRLKQTTSLEGSTSRSASVRSFAGGRADEPQLGLPCLELRAGDGAPGGLV